MATQFEPAKSLKRLNATLSHPLPEEDLVYAVAALNDIGRKLDRLPIFTCQILCCMVGRLERVEARNLNSEYHNELWHEAMIGQFGLDRDELNYQISRLDECHIATLEYEDEKFEAESEIRLMEIAGGWFPWSDLKEFSVKTGVPLDAILIGLQFNLLD